MNASIVVNAMVCPALRHLQGMKNLRLVAVLLPLLAGAVQANETTGNQSESHSGARQSGAPVQPAPESIVDEPTDFESYEQRQRCVSLRQIKSHELIGDEFVVFHMRGGKVMLNQLRSSCTGPTFGTVLRLNTHGSSRACSLDGIELLPQHFGRVPDVFGRPGGTAVGHCRLGEFAEIDEDRLAVIKEAVRQAANDTNIGGRK